MQTQRIGLFLTCLADAVRPSIPAASLKILKEAGYEVSIPKEQTCCSQPAFNSGDEHTSRAMGKSIIENFERFDYVVIPSGSCGGMLKVHLPELFQGDAKWYPRAKELAAKTYEILSFLTDVANYTPAIKLSATISYHDSCAGLRELGIKKQPRELIDKVDGLTLKEMTQSEQCCGFGGTFCVKFPPISARLGDNKIESTLEQQPDYLVGGDLGCLLHVCGRAQHCGHSLKAYHLIEILAGYVDKTPPIGTSREG